MSAPTTDVAVHSSSELAIQSGQTGWTDKQVAALRQLGVDSASNADLAVFWHQCIRTGLDPFARQIYMISRQGKQTIQTGIDGFRLIARRAVDYAGETLGYEDTQWCGPDGTWREVWLPAEAPAAARVTVLRNGQRYPAVALYSEYVATKADGKPTAMWAGKPALMLAKCAEALALRKAFPQDLSGIYTSDEMGQAGPSRDDAPAGHGTGPGDEAAEALVTAPSANLEAALAGIDVSTTVDQLRAVWDQHAPQLTTPEKARIHEAMKDAKARIEAGADSDGVVDADVVSESPPPGTDDDDDRRLASRGQLQKLSIKFEACGLTSKAEHRDDILAVCSALAQRTIRTRNELTVGEANDIDDALTECLDADDTAATVEMLLDSARTLAKAAAA